MYKLEFYYVDLVKVFMRIGINETVWLQEHTCEHDDYTYVSVMDSCVIEEAIRLWTQSQVKPHEKKSVYMYSFIYGFTY